MRMLFSFRKKQRQPQKCFKKQHKIKTIRFGPEAALYHAPQLSFLENAHADSVRITWKT